MKSTPISETPSSEPELDLKRYLALAWHWAWLFVIAAAAGGTVGFFYAKRTPPVYAARTTVLINEAPATRFADVQSLQLGERLAPTYTRLLTSRAIRMKVEESAGTEISSKDIRIRPDAKTQFIEIEAEHTDPVKAAEIANTFFYVFSEELVLMQAERYASSKARLQAEVDKMELQIAETSDLLRGSRSDTEKESIRTRMAQYQQIFSNLLMNLEQIRLAEAQTTANVTQIDAAVPPTHPVRPQVRKSALIAAFLGLLLAAGAVFGYEALDDTVRNPEEISRTTLLPTLAVIARHDTAPGNLIALKEPRSPVAEAFRSLRTSVQFAGVDRPLRCLMVTSPTPFEGKTTVSANLAVVLAHGGLRTCLLDGDLRRPMIHKIMGLPNTGGLSGLFVQSNPIADSAVIETPIPGLRVLPAGPPPPNPSELLGSNKMQKILDALLETNDMVIVDTPPLLPVTDAAVLTRHVDGILMVYRPGSTKKRAIQQAVEQWRRIGVNLVGFVANDVNLNRGGNGNYYYREYYSTYAYYSEDHPKKGKTRKSNGMSGQA